jgi:hypothetical protein
MAVRSYSLGQLNPVVYFENRQGVIALPPSTKYALMIKDRMRDRGFEFREAGTLAEIDRLQSRMQQQEYRQRQREVENDERLASHVRASVASRLYNRMLSGSTSEYEKEFIRIYLRTREDKREKHRKRFEQDQMYFEAREFDSSTKHLQSAADRVPEQKDVECTRCHAAQRAIGTLCLKCANQVRSNAHAG